MLIACARVASLGVDELAQLLISGLRLCQDSFVQFLEDQATLDISLQPLASLLPGIVHLGLKSNAV